MSQHTIVHRVVHPAVAAVARIPRITPNHLTALRYASGCLAACCFALGSPRGLVLGGGAFLLSFLLDRADGALARATGRFSRAGRAFDAWADCSADMLAFLTLGFAASGRSGSPLPVACGIAAAIATALSCWLVSQASADRPATTRPFDPDDALLVIPAVAWLDAGFGHDLLTPFLVLAAAGSAAFTVWSWRSHGVRARMQPCGTRPRA